MVVELEELCIDDWGTEIVLDTEVDTASATQLQIVGNLPNGDPIEWDAVAEGATQVKYVTEEGDHGQTVGFMKLRARVISLAGQWTGREVRVRVVDPVA